MGMEYDGGLAFPDPARASGHPMESGMSLRDWFAGQALAGLLAYPENGEWFKPTSLARAAYDYADAMIAERSVT